MTKLKQRLQKLEMKAEGRPLSEEETERQYEALFASRGVTREAVIAQHGSIGAYCHYLLCQIDANGVPQGNIGKSAQEAYFEMLRKKK